MVIVFSTIVIIVHGVTSLLYKSASVLLIFFFQAEDGIRDYKVTGVQTCALPISVRASSASSVFEYRFDPQRSDGMKSGAGLPAGTYSTPAALSSVKLLHMPPPVRSEERRVGKEGGESGSPRQ